MNGRALVVMLSAGLSGWIDRIAALVTQRAALSAPGALSVRLAEEWLAALSEQRGSWRRLSFARGSVLCEINTTPLIDVMLVLLVTLMISLPIMTHAVKLDLPRTPASQDKKQPEVIDLDIDFDGTLAWNGTPVATMQQLESYLRGEARKDPQPEVHLRADRRVKYDFVAKVLASAQRNQMKRIGFVDTAAFKD